MKASKRIKTVLYNDQRLSPGELEVLHTPAVQRLYGLRQLGFADRIFVDASHSRLHHVVGVLHHVDKLISAMVTNLERGDRVLQIGPPDASQKFTSKRLARMVNKRRFVVRLVGLLHDLTHAPFGHTVEDEIQLVDTKHDEPARQADAFYRLLCQLIAWLGLESLRPGRTLVFPEALRPCLAPDANFLPPEPAVVGGLARQLLAELDEASAKLCWRLSQRDFAQLLAQLRCAMTALLHLEALHKSDLAAKDLPEAGQYHFQEAIDVALSGTKYEKLLKDFDFQADRDAYMLDVVGNTVCADLLDYAKRDSHFAGLHLDYDADRIAENFTLVSFQAVGRKLPSGRTDPFSGRCFRAAISLVSHKYRTDVPSELMQLLNVRFYLYERVIFHPTKCAAGAMLGTGLQLLGWRNRPDSSERPTLPTHLRFVGDEVFLHDIRAALSYLVRWTTAKEGSAKITSEDLAAAGDLDQVHNGLVPALLALRIGQSTKKAQGEFAAARLLLDRLAARRYLRQVFRALPNSEDPRLRGEPAATDLFSHLQRPGADVLAEVFRNPDTRFAAERAIESGADLPTGSIVIHCPPRKTAEKIANVLLTRPDVRSGLTECKLHDIATLDDKVFGKHQDAVRAVEAMYRSMWRLAVYVAPEHMPNFKLIGNVAGRVIFKTVAPDSLADLAWENDPHLLKELETKLGQTRGIPDPESQDLSGFGQMVGQIADAMVESGDLDSLPPELYGLADDLSEPVRSRIEGALRASIVRSEPEEAPAPFVVSDVDRIARLVTLLKTHAKSTRKQLEATSRTYESYLARLSADGYATVYRALEKDIAETRRLEKRALGRRARSGFALTGLLDRLDHFLSENGVRPPDKRDPGVYKK